MKNRFLLIALTILTTGFFVTSSLQAGDELGNDPGVQPEAQPDTQPQSQSPTTVGRLSVIQGQVSTMHGDGTQWVAGTINTPVMPGDKVATADRARAEIQLDPANVMRLDEHTEAQVADLEQNKIQIQLASGLVDFSVLNGTQADVEVDTPNMGVHPLSPGIYRIQVNSPTETLLIVRKGEAEVLTNQGSTKVEAGQIIQIHGSDNPEYKIDSAPGGDDFDKWCSNRDRDLTRAESAQNSNVPYTGSSDLNTYGQWNEVPDYGWCWTPQVDAGWVPYSAGNWGWEPYYGWTWISYEPWGWAPYHYGRWFMYGGAWRWWPAVGAFGLRAMWAPAYVSFFGFGGRGFGFGLGFGSIGWLALGPRDIFHPWFGAGHSFGAMNFNEFHGPGFVRAGGPSYGSNLERAMSDPRMRGAIRNVSSSDFASGRMGRSMPVSESMMRGGSMMRGSLPVAHTQASMGRVASFSANRSVSSEHFFSSSRGASAAGRSYTMTGRAGGSTASYGARSNSYSMGQTGARGSTNNWQRYASPNPYSGARSGYGQSTQRGGYQGYSGQSRGYSGGGYAGRSGSSYYGGGSRPPLQLNQPVMRQRAPGGGYYGGGRNYSSPSGGGRSYSAPSGGRNYSPPKSSGGGGGGGHSYSGGGGHSYGGGGGGHSSGGGHGGGRR